jgi:hypothetical protein
MIKSKGHFVIKVKEKDKAKREFFNLIYTAAETD